MAQEFTIKSQDIEDKINQLLPSQGGFQPGVDFSASTMVIPIVDLTETAEGSSLRQDLQSSLSLSSITSFSVSATTTTILNTTGYYRIFGSTVIGATGNISFDLTDGFTSKRLLTISAPNTTNTYDFIVFLEAGHSVSCVVGSGSSAVGCTRQIADISGNLVNP